MHSNSIARSLRDQLATLCDDVAFHQKPRRKVISAIRRRLQTLDYKCPELRKQMFEFSQLLLCRVYTVFYRTYKNYLEFVPRWEDTLRDWSYQLIEHDREATIPYYAESDLTPPDESFIRSPRCPRQVLKMLDELEQIIRHSKEKRVTSRKTASGALSAMSLSP